MAAVNNLYYIYSFLLPLCAIILLFTCKTHKVFSITEGPLNFPELYIKKNLCDLGTLLFFSHLFQSDLFRCWWLQSPANRRISHFYS